MTVTLCVHTSFLTVLSIHYHTRCGKHKCYFEKNKKNNRFLKLLCKTKRTYSVTYTKVRENFKNEDPIDIAQPHVVDIAHPVLRIRAWVIQSDCGVFFVEKRKVKTSSNVANFHKCPLT